MFEFEEPPLEPPPAPKPQAPPPPPPPPPVEVPFVFLLTNAPLSLQYRAIRAFLPDEAQPSHAPVLAYSHRPAARLAVAQGIEGTWNDAMLRVPSATAKEPYAAVGTIAAVHRLLEEGWDRESPPLVNARRVLFRLLAEDTSPDLMFDLRADARDLYSAQRARQVLREAAAGALAHAGYELDPRLRGAATRAVNRVRDFLDSDLAANPWVGEQTLAPDATPPSLHFLAMLAFMPVFRHEHHEFIEALGQYLGRPVEADRLFAHPSKAAPHEVALLGDPLPTSAAAAADPLFALLWLELAARIGILQGNEGWGQRYDELLAKRSADYVWHVNGSKAGSPATHGGSVGWAFAPWSGSEAGRACQATFRLGLIARLTGRAIDLV